MKVQLVMISTNFYIVTSASSNSNPQRGGLRVMTPIGQIEADEAAHRGVSQLIIKFVANVSGLAPFQWNLSFAHF